MKTLKENFGTIIVCLLEIIVGILLLIDPVGFTSTIITAIGAVLFIRGIFSIISYFRKNVKIASAEQSMAKGLIAIMGGLFCILKNGVIIDVFSILTLLYGIGVLLLGTFKVQFTFDLIRTKKRWALSAISALLTLGFAVLIIFNPFESTKMLWIFIAVTLIFEALLDIISVFISDGKKRTPSQNNA